MHLFDRSILNIKPLAERKHDLNLSVIKRLSSNTASSLTKRMYPVCEDIIRAKEGHKAVMLMIGGHVIRSGVQNYLIDLMKRGYISCIAMNGAGMIHDFEFALIGATTENVSRYIKEGQFGLWQVDLRRRRDAGRSATGDPQARDSEQGTHCATALFGRPAFRGSAREH